jgi:hypothetical protein
MLRYIVVEPNYDRDFNNKTPIVKVFSSRIRAEEYANESEHECKVFRIGPNLVPEEIEPTEIVKPN